jgi:hypothetical protein
MPYDDLPNDGWGRRPRWRFGRKPTGPLSGDVVVSGERMEQLLQERRDSAEGIKALQIEVADLRAKILGMAFRSDAYEAMGYDLAVFLGRVDEQGRPVDPDPEADLDTVITRLIDAERTIEGVRASRDDADVSPVLLDGLRLLANQYGAGGVALAAARLSDPSWVAARLTEGISDPTEPVEAIEPIYDTPFDLQWSEGEEPSIRAAVYQAVGAASTCWESLSLAGYFDEQDAREVAEVLLRFIRQHEVEPLLDASADAFTILANVSEGDWSQQTQEWQDAVVRWRDEVFHPLLARHGLPASAEVEG